MKLAERLEEAHAFIAEELTKSEERVVNLLVNEGLSDKEIAERLYISSRTVEQHLRSAYSKASCLWNINGVTRTHLISILNLYYSTKITGKPA